MVLIQWGKRSFISQSVRWGSGGGWNKGDKYRVIGNKKWKVSEHKKYEKYRKYQNIENSPFIDLLK